MQRFPLLLAALVPACVPKESPKPAFVVTHDSLATAAPVGTPRRVFLNERLRVDFSAPVDPLSVTPVSVRLRDLTDNGLVACRVVVQTSSVVLVPAAPCRADLGDGVLRLDRAYRLEIGGFPSTSSVRSTSGQVLERCFSREFKTVTADQEPSPLLPVGVGDPRYATFAVQFVEPVAEDLRSFRIYLNLPPLPSTVTADAFDVRSTTGDAVAIATAHVVPQGELGSAWAPLLEGMSFPGSVVEVVLDRVPPGQMLWLMLAEAPRGMKDYSGRPISELRFGDMQRMARVAIQPGTRVEVFRMAFSSPLTLPPTRPGVLGFNLGLGAGRKPAGFACPAWRPEAGMGRLGSFEPKRDTVLSPGVPFDRGDGEQVRSDDGSFEFTRIVIPAGVQVTVRSELPVRLRSMQDVRIEGVLALDATPLAAPGYADLAKHVVNETVEQIVDGAGVALVTGASLTVAARGEIRRQPKAEGSPLTLFSGGRLRLFGKVCPGAFYATDLPPPEGDDRSSFLCTNPSYRGIPSGPGLEAESWTPWQRIPDGRGTADEVRIEGASGAIEVVSCQIVAPNPNDPSRPADDDSLLPQPIPIPLAAPLPCAAGNFVRFLIRARLEASRPLPCLRGIVMLSR